MITEGPQEETQSIQEKDTRINDEGLDEIEFVCQSATLIRGNYIIKESSGDKNRDAQKKDFFHQFYRGNLDYLNSKTKSSLK